MEYEINTEQRVDNMANNNHKYQNVRIHPEIYEEVREIAHLERESMVDILSKSVRLYKEMKQQKSIFEKVNGSKK